MTDNIEALYHYTGIDGFKGIIDSGCLHATNVKYLNDSQEFIFGLDYFSKLFSYPDYNTQIDENIEISLYDHLIEHLFSLSIFELKQSKQAFNWYVISFSTQPDILSQWRGYGKDNAGYCLKFNFKKLFYPSDVFPLLIPKVDYIDPDDLSFARESLNAVKLDWRSEFIENMPWLESHNIDEYNKMLALMGVIDCAQDYDDNDIPDWYEFINTFRFFAVDTLVSSMAYKCKHHSFREEDEYRLVFNSSNSDPKIIKFKVGNTFLVPYVEVQYNFEKGNIIEEVVVGPCPHPVEAASSAQQFLDSKLGASVNVIDSKIPFRYW